MQGIDKVVHNAKQLSASLDFLREFQEVGGFTYTILLSTYRRPACIQASGFDDAVILP